VERLFEAARERAWRERADVLAAACAGDPTLQREVESLLAADENAGDFLESLDEERVAELIAVAAPAEEGGTDVRGAAHVLDQLKAALADRYTVRSEIGRGGMATVYLADDIKHHRRVAIKVLKPDLAGLLGRDRFLREIEIAARLTHPHILPLHDSGEAAGLLYYVMPYVAGESLRDRLHHQKRLPLDDALQIAREVADALGAAHNHGLVHRDVKPENILLEGGHAVISDFGIARAITEAGGDRLGASGVAIGTPAYMSPEQATGEQPLDGRSDLYSLGCVLYEMLVGKPPFKGKSARTIFAKHAHEPAPGLREISNVPKALKRVILRCLGKTPDARYRTAAELEDRLTACQAELSARRLGIGPLLRRPAVVTALVALAVVIVAAGGWVWRQQSRERWARMVALPEATQFIEQGRNYSAFRLLRQAEAIIPEDPLLQELLMESTVLVTVRTTPPGAEVHVRDYFDEPEAWEALGRAPIENVRLPTAVLVWKVSQEGFQTRRALRFTPARTFEFSLQSSIEAPAGMVYVEGGPYGVFGSRPVELESYWIDQYEVTNLQFKEFIDGGGYERREYWTEPFVHDGEPVSWDDARQRFRDRTGRPGPATWELASHMGARELSRGTG
jgi:tRNA A-37 threonylcarbamoyl transferase component Bud32